MKCKLTMCVHGHDDDPEEFETLRAALRYANAAVDANTAAPKRLDYGQVVFGGKNVTFDTDQIYAMLEMVRE